MGRTELFLPRVSIIIPVYNGSDCLREAIDSALAQTYSNVEVIVINDGSKDGGKTQAIINSYGSRIRAYYKDNGGVASALNLGIDQMTGEYFSWLSHDDKYLPNKIASQINKLLEVGNKQAIIYSGYFICNERGKILSEFKPSSQYPIDKYQHPLFPVLRLLINGCTLLFHKEHFNRVGGFNIDLRTTQDYDMWYRLFKDQVVIYCDEIGVVNRSHRKQTSKTHLSEHIKECDKLWIDMLSKLSEEELQAIDDNAYAFFKKTYDFLKIRTLYYETIQFAELRTLQTLRKLLLKGMSYKRIVTEATEIFEGDAYIHQVLEHREILNKEKPRIAFLASERYGKGGLMKIFNLITQELAKSYEVIIFYSMGGMNTHCEREGNIIRIKIGTSGKWEERLARFMTVLDIDAFVGSHNCLLHHITLYSIIRAYGIKCVAWNHEDYLFPYINKAYQVVGEKRKPVFHQLDAVIWINKASKVIYDKEGKNGIYIPNCIEIGNASEASMTKKEFSIISVGRYQDRVKRIDRLLEAFAIINKRNPQIKLYIVGDNCLDMRLSVLGNQTVRERMNQLGIAIDKVIFTGWQSDMSAYYRRAMLQICTSESEGFGLVIPEAGIYGVPTISFSNGGADTIIVNGENGYIVNSVIEMVERTNLLFENYEVYQHMSAQSKALSRNYSKELIAGRWKKLFDSLINQDSQLFGSLVNDKALQAEYDKINGCINERNRQLKLQG